MGFFIRYAKRQGRATAEEVVALLSVCRTLAPEYLKHMMDITDAGEKAIRSARLELARQMDGLHCCNVCAALRLVPDDLAIIQDTLCVMGNESRSQVLGEWLARWERGEKLCLLDLLGIDD